MKVLRTILLSALLSLAPLLPGVVLADEVAPLASRPEVPFVPTPEEVVAEMLEMAAVDADDVLYDLGCGDGRIVITAARERGARGVGVDIDPDRIQESRQNAAQAQVTDRVQFIQSDLFEVDLRPASVVTLYLLPNVNLRLRPKLLRELAPGTRVVSHDFDMGEWVPQETARLSGHSVYFWVIPANATGNWESRREDGVRLELSQEFQSIEGTATVNGQRLPIREGRLDGDRLRFVLAQGRDSQEKSAVFEGRLRGDVLEGELRPAAGQPSGWQLGRDPATRRDLEPES